MNTIQKVCLAVFVINVVARNSFYVLLYIYANLNYVIVPFLILSDTVSYATATLFLLSKATSANNNYRLIHQLQTNENINKLINKFKQISQKYGQPKDAIIQHQEQMPKYPKLEQEIQRTNIEVELSMSIASESQVSATNEEESSPLKTHVGIRRDGGSDRKVNDFVRSILIEDDRQYDFLNVTDNSHKEGYIYDYPRLTYDPKQYQEKLRNQKIY